MRIRRPMFQVFYGYHVTGVISISITTLGDRAFPVDASHAWNSLPASVRDIQSLPAFRQKLKLTLFSDSFLPAESSI